jgi:hypothetical protein
MPFTDILFIVSPIVAAMIVVLLVTFRVLRREYYWAVIPFAVVAIVALLLTS